MANIRAERQALDRLPGDAMPLKSFDVIDEAYAEAPAAVTITTESGEVDTGIGEIIESKAEPVDTKPEHWCHLHNCEYERKVRGSSVWYAHKHAGDWCNELKRKAPSPAETADTIASEQLVKLETLAKEKGANIGEMVKAKGWPATKPSELSFDQAQVLIDDLTG